MIEFELSGSSLNEECGIFALHHVEDASVLTYYGLHSLQHRGQEACGIATSDGSKILTRKDKGLVTDVFDKPKLDEIGENAIHALGHVLYGKRGGNIQENIQPIMVRAHQGAFALANNGEIVNAGELRYELEQQGSIFQGTSDTEVIAHLIQREQGSMAEKILAACKQLRGAYTIVIMTKNTMYAVRDPLGLRPLCLGKVNGGYAISSESCAFTIINAEFSRDLRPGEMLKMGKEKFESIQFSPPGEPSICAMEYIYFSRPDSDIDGINVHSSRKACGRELARMEDVEADIVVGVPDSSLSASQGYAEESCLPNEMGLIKSRYVGRSFIKPRQSDRERGVKMKLSPVRSVLAGKRVVLVDDSIVRGTTSKRIVNHLFSAGAKEVHVRIASPPLRYPCFYGIDLHSSEELIAGNRSEEEIRQYIGATSLKFLPLETLRKILGNNICTSCFTGEYPIPIPKQSSIYDYND